MLIQILAGITAAFTYALVYREKEFNSVYIGPNRKGGYDWYDVAAGEIIFTFVLTYVVLCVATTTPPGPKEPHSRDMFGLAIASCVTVGGFAVGPTGAGALNPAVCIGAASANAFAIFVNALAYTAFEMLGAALAAAIFHITHASEYKSISYSAPRDFPRYESREIQVPRAQARAQALAIEVHDGDYSHHKSGDPYVIVEQEGTGMKQRTSTKKNTNDPRWNEAFEFPFMPGQDIKFVLMDEDSGRDDFLGHGKLHAHKFADGHTSGHVELDMKHQHHKGKIRVTARVL
jgi:glycerol uptake facilitator-like aquaporin